MVLFVSCPLFFLFPNIYIVPWWEAAAPAGSFPFMLEDTRRVGWNETFLSIQSVWNAALKRYPFPPPPSETTNENSKVASTACQSTCWFTTKRLLATNSLPYPVGDSWIAGIWVPPESLSTLKRRSLGQLNRFSPKKSPVRMGRLNQEQTRVWHVETIQQTSFVIFTQFALWNFMSPLGTFWGLSEPIEMS